MPALRATGMEIIWKPGWRKRTPEGPRPIQETSSYGTVLERRVKVIGLLDYPV